MKATSSLLPPAFFSAAAIAATAGCASQPPPQQALPTPAAEGDGVVRPFVPPLELTDNPNKDAIVRVVGGVSCSGALIDDDLVLTAHHCVVARDDRGHPLKRDMNPSELTVELGQDYLPWGEVGVRDIVAPDCGYVSGHGDIAILVLDRKLVGMPVLTPRISEAPRKGAELRPLGFGRCAGSGDAIRLVERGGGGVTDVRPGTFSGMASICPGDSGGPVTTGSAAGGVGEIVGIISASAMDADPTSRASSIFTRLDRWQPLFSAAREIADGASAAELPPFRYCHAPEP